MTSNDFGVKSNVPRREPGVRDKLRMAFATSSVDNVHRAVPLLGELFHRKQGLVHHQPFTDSLGDSLGHFSAMVNLLKPVFSPSLLNTVGGGNS